MDPKIVRDAHTTRLVFLTPRRHERLAILANATSIALIVYEHSRLRNRDQGIAPTRDSKPLWERRLRRDRSITNDLAKKARLSYTRRRVLPDVAIDKPRHTISVVPKKDLRDAHTTSLSSFLFHPAYRLLSPTYCSLLTAYYYYCSNSIKTRSPCTIFNRATVPAFTSSIYRALTRES